MNPITYCKSRRNQYLFDFAPGQTRAGIMTALLAERDEREARKAARKAKVEVEPTPEAPALAEPTFAPDVVAFWSSFAGTPAVVSSEVEAGPSGLNGQACFAL